MFNLNIRAKKGYCLLLLMIAMNAFAADITFEDISILGNRRISDDRLLELLPFAREKQASMHDISVAIRELYALKYFEDVRISLLGTTLLIEVVERPTIAEIAIEGNKAIPTEAIVDVLKQAEIVRGEIYNRSLLGIIQQELLKAYHNEGRYNASIEIGTEKLGRAGIAVKIEVTEGGAFVIKQIRIVGNQKFTASELTTEFQLGVKKWYNWFSSKDKYSRNRLETDLEVLQSYYLDRGYISYRNIDTNITLEPEHSAVFINISILEGERHRVQNISLVAPNSISHLALAKLILVRKGAVFSYQQATDSITIINDFLSNYGYTYSAVDITTEIVDEENNLVDVNFIVKPGELYYIDKIKFSGNFTTRNEVLRRELRQLEGSLYSKARLERSKIRLQRLGYIDSAEYALQVVPNKDNLLDVEFNIVERRSGNFTVGASYARDFGFSFNLGLSQDNFLSTGDFLSLQAQRNIYSEVYSLSYRTAYFTNTGVSRTIALYHSSYNSARLNSSNYTLDTDSVAVSYQIPLTEFTYWTTGAQYRSDQISYSIFSPDELFRFINSNGVNYDSVWLNNTFYFDSLNRSIFPTDGTLVSLGLSTTVYNTSFNYGKLSFRTESYFSLVDSIVFINKFEIGAGYSYSNSTDELPPYEKYHLGGINNLRAFRVRGVGPLDSRGVRYGGDAYYYGALELQINPLADQVNTGTGAVRVVLFGDYGYVFPRISDTRLSEFRYDLGVGISWITPIGPLLFSYAFPFNHDRSVDNVRQFQFSIGSSF